MKLSDCATIEVFVRSAAIGCINVPSGAGKTEIPVNIETLPDPSTHARARRTSCWLDQNSKSKYADAIIYATTNYWYIRKTVRFLAPSPDDVVYDLGCGKGRFLCVMAQRPVRRCVGIDLSPSLCEIARTNARRLRGRKTEIEIICADCSDADLHEGTIYYMFNPFGLRTMCAVLENIYRSLVSNPRRITIVYHNPAHEEVLESCRWLELFEGFETFRGQRASFWGNRKIPLLGGLPAGIAPHVLRLRGGGIMPHLPRAETLPAQAERRRSQRTHVITSVTVAWHAEDGRYVSEQAETVEVSASGALLRMEKDHPLRQVIELIRGPEPEHTLARVMRSGPLSPEGGTLVAVQLAAPSEVFWGIEFYSGA